MVWLVSAIIPLLAAVYVLRGRQTGDWSWQGLIRELIRGTGTINTRRR